MRSVYCGICRIEYNLPGTGYPDAFVERHIHEHQRENKSTDEDYEVLRSKKPSKIDQNFQNIMGKSFK